jgi:hypothetical protein
MSPPSGADKVSPCYSSSNSSTDGDCRRHQEEEEEDDYTASDNDRRRRPEEEEEDNYANDAGSQVTFDTSSIVGTDFLTPGGLNLFTVALPAKTEKLFAKDLPKIIKASGMSKKNYRATIDVLNVEIGQLWKTAIAENSTARSIHDIAKEALKHGSKSLDDALTKVVKLEEELSKTKSKLTHVFEKLREAVFGQDAATAKEKTTSKTLKTTQKELGNAKKELAEAKEELLKKEVESGASRRGRGGSRNKTRGDSMERLCEKERIRLNAFKLKSGIARKNKEKEEKRKYDAKHDNACTIQAMGGRDNPFVQNSRSSSDSQGKSGRRSCRSRSHSCSGSNSRGRRSGRRSCCSQSRSCSGSNSRGRRSGRRSRRSRSCSRSTRRGSGHRCHRSRSRSGRRGRDSRSRRSPSCSRSRSRTGGRDHRSRPHSCSRSDSRARRDCGPSHSRSHQNDPLLNHSITTDLTCYDPPSPIQTIQTLNYNNGRHTAFRMQAMHLILPWTSI